jgi:hypothetical protein
MMGDKRRNLLLPRSFFFFLHKAPKPVQNALINVSKVTRKGESAADHIPSISSQGTLEEKVR